MSNEEFKSQDAAAVAATEAAVAAEGSVSAEADADNAAVSAAGAAGAEAAADAGAAGDAAEAGEVVSLVDEVTSGTDVLRLTEEQLAHLEQRPQSRDGTTGVALTTTLRASILVARMSS